MVILGIISVYILHYFHCQKYIEKVWEIKGMEKLPFLQAIYLQCSSCRNVASKEFLFSEESMAYVNFGTICYQNCLFFHFVNFRIWIALFMVFCSWKILVKSNLINRKHESLLPNFLSFPWFWVNKFNVKPWFSD